MTAVNFGPVELIILIFPGEQAHPGVAEVLTELAAYGAGPAWFGLGDRDIATHLHRTAMLTAGVPLSSATAAPRTNGSSMRVATFPSSFNSSRRNV